MASLRSTRSKKGEWSNYFSFPTIGMGNLGGPICYWNGEDWAYLGEERVGVFPPKFEAPSDQVTGILEDGKQIKVVTKAGVSFRAPVERMVKRVVGSAEFLVLDIPSVYDVWMGVSMFRVLGCFGYNDEKKHAVIFNVKNLEMYEYGCSVVNARIMFDPTEESSGNNPKFATAPAYSSEHHRPAPPTEVQNLRSEIRAEIEQRPYAPADDGYVIGDTKEVLKQVEESMKREQDLRSKLIKIINPTAEEEVELVRVIDGKLKRVRGKTSEEVRKKSMSETFLKGKAILEAQFKEQLEAMGVKGDGNFPLPDQPQEVVVVRPQSMDIPIPKDMKFTTGTTPPGTKTLWKKVTGKLLGTEDDFEVL